MIADHQDDRGSALLVLWILFALILFGAGVWWWILELLPADAPDRLRGTSTMIRGVIGEGLNR